MKDLPTLLLSFSEASVLDTIYRCLLRIFISERVVLFFLCVHVYVCVHVVRMWKAEDSTGSIP